MTKNLSARDFGGATHAAGMSARDLEKWFATSAGGASVIYFTGLLGSTRPFSDAVHEAAITVWRLAAQGLADLTQRRLERLSSLPPPWVSTKGFEYRITKRRSADRKLLGPHAPDEPEVPLVKRMKPLRAAAA
jgi:hypothetical protein